MQIQVAEVQPPDVRGAEIHAGKARVLHVLEGLRGQLREVAAGNAQAQLRQVLVVAAAIGFVGRADLGHVGVLEIEIVDEVTAGLGSGAVDAGTRGVERIHQGAGELGIGEAGVRELG